MAVFRIEKTRDYTVMSNHHLRNAGLSLKSKGLLSMMLSLPEDWNYTTRGLAKICKEGTDSIGSALKELERAGYIVRNRLRDSKGKIVDVEYVIYETPHPPDTGQPCEDDPDTACPDTENPDMDNPCLENRPQLNKEERNPEKQNTDSPSTEGSNPIQSSPQTPAEAKRTGRDWMRERESYRELILENIEYDILVQNERMDHDRLDELVELFDITKCSKAGAKFDYVKGLWFNREYILMKDNKELAPAFDKILRENGIEAPMERVEAVVGMMKMKKINFIKELWPLCDFFFIAPEAYDREDKFVRKNWTETAAADMAELAALLEGLDDFSVEGQKAAVDRWAEETGKKPWNPWRVALVGTGKGPDMYELSAFLGKEETLRRMRKAVEILK